MRNAIIRVPIISTTGTKGKTSFTTVLADVLNRLGKEVLHVTTVGHFLNGEQRSTNQDSRDLWNLVPTLAPGRYLWDFFKQPELTNNGVAVLECSIGCNYYSGLGYRFHNVGVFLNVFEDHVGSETAGGKIMRTKADIAEAKEFIFRKIDRDGWAVFNADDEHVCGRLHALPEKVNVRKIPCGASFKHFDVDKHLAEGGVAFSVQNNYIVRLFGNSTEPVCDLKQMPWAFDGKYLPSVMNLMHVAAAAYAFYEEKLPDNFRSVLEATRLNPYGGRLTVLRAANGAKIIADYAHEKVSLSHIGGLARALTGDGGKAIGVVRLSFDRTDRQIHETGQVIGRSMDELVVYDKIDGHWAKPKVSNSWRFPQVVGRTSELLAKGIQEENPNVTRIIREDEAIAYAAELAGPEDVVVIIVGDDIRRSIGFIRDSFKAEFIS